jgi:hypothetical protein
MKNRRRLLLLIMTAALLVALALPAVHWRLYGWCSGEPFYRGRPASYWRAEVAACDVVLLPGLELMASSMIGRGDRPPAPCIVLLPRPGMSERLQRWLAERLGIPKLAADRAHPLADCDDSAVPVLMALLGDRDPKVRYFSAQTLGFLNGDRRAALPALRELVSDRAAVNEEWTVGDAAAEAAYRVAAGYP